MTLILGGVRSGKSCFAEELAADWGDRVLYVATAEGRDAEMCARIDMHRRARPPAWRTLDAPVSVGRAIRDALADDDADGVLLDCLTMLVSNLLLQGPPTGEEAHQVDAAAAATAQERVEAEMDDLLDTFRGGDIPWAVVSNEVGWGLVPAYPLGRVYRDLLGWANQRLAAEADRVVLMVAGLPIDAKATNGSGPTRGG